MTYFRCIKCGMECTFVRTAESHEDRNPGHEMHEMEEED